jgi:hypothetical protein
MTQAQRCSLRAPRQRRPSSIRSTASQGTLRPVSRPGPARRSRRVRFWSLRGPTAVGRRRRKMFTCVNALYLNGTALLGASPAAWSNAGGATEGTARATAGERAQIVKGVERRASAWLRRRGYLADDLSRTDRTSRPWGRLSTPAHPSRWLGVRWRRCRPLEKVAGGSLGNWRDRMDAARIGPEERRAHDGDAVGPGEPRRECGNGAPRKRNAHQRP